MNKLLIIPIISAICLLVKVIFGIDIGTEDQNTIAEAVFALITIVGLFIDPKKKDNQ
jgi:uncharacterized membrane protein